MAVSEEYRDYIEDQLGVIGGVNFKKMFGGFGIFKDGMMFGMISPGDIFRMRVDEQNQSNYEKAGMKQFPSHHGKKGMPYWDVPSQVLETTDELKSWAQKSIDVALRANK